MIKTPVRIAFLWDVEDYDRRIIAINDNRIGEINRNQSIPVGTIGAYDLRIFGSKSTPMTSLSECERYVQEKYGK